MGGSRRSGQDGHGRPAAASLRAREGRIRILWLVLRRLGRRVEAFLEKPANLPVARARARGSGHGQRGVGVATSAPCLRIRCVLGEGRKAPGALKEVSRAVLAAVLPPGHVARKKVGKAYSLLGRRKLAKVLVRPRRELSATYMRMLNVDYYTTRT